jgi:hypothetical protein
MWKISDRPFRVYPEGTSARAGGGGHWTKTHQGHWKWCNSHCSFPTPGGDWDGMVWVPEETVLQESDLVSVSFTFGKLRYRIFSDSKHTDHPFDGYLAGWFDEVSDTKSECEYYRNRFPGTLYKVCVFGSDEKFVGFLNH